MIMKAHMMGQVYQNEMLNNIRDGIQDLKEIIYKELAVLIHGEWLDGNKITPAEVVTQVSPITLKLEFYMKYQILTDKEYKEEQERLEVGL